ncbi:hypothetical protein [Chitinimonas lacunae]|uniref:YfhO family protein n=1 Tax=Chitinimonas lacunae TaxID=1963018 RepID=A0ABV8MTZ4_9NEIS
MMLAHSPSSAGWSARSLPPLLGPVLVFACYLVMVARHTQNIPYWDDYDAILIALLDLHRDGNWFNFLFHPHVDHLIVPVKLLGEVQWRLFGRVDFAWYIYLGNLSLFGLYLCWRATFPHLRERPLWQVMAALALFNLSYWEASIWAMTALSNLPVLVLAWASLVWLARPSRGAFGLGLGLAVLATFTQGNGLLLFAAGVLVLVPQRRWRALALWLLVGAALAAFYIGLRQYFVVDTKIANASTLLLSRPHEVLMFFLAFIGAGFRAAHAAMAAGALLLIGLALAWWRVPTSRSPVLLAWLGLLLLSALAATWSRASIGVEAALSSRYSLYGCLLLALLIGMAAPAIDQMGRGRKVLSWLLMALLAVGWVATYRVNKAELRQHYDNNLALQAEPGTCSVYAYPGQTHAAKALAEARATGLFPIDRIRNCVDIESSWLSDWPPAVRADGSLDRITVEGAAVVAVGWVRLPDTLPERRLELSAPVAPSKIELASLDRPDVAVALSDPGLRRSGFILRLEYPSTEAANAALLSLCLGYRGADGQRVVLPHRAAECLLGQ